MIRQRGSKYHFQFVKGGKLYSGVCEGCSTKREAEAYEKRMRDRQAAFAEQKSVDRLMERRRQEITGRAGIALADAFEESLKKPHRRAASVKVIEQKRSAWRDFVSFMAAKHPETTELAAVTPSQAEEYIAGLRTTGRFQREVKYQRSGRTVTTAAADGAPSNRTATLYQVVCTEVFNLLARDAGIAENPFAGIAKPPKIEENREAFTPEELQLIHENLNDFTRPLFTVAIMTALREGDICTLRWGEINFGDRTIRRTMNKTGRLVEIPIARELQTYLEKQKMQTGDGEFVFPDLAAMYSKNPHGVSYRVKQFLEGLGIQTTRKIPGRTRAVSVKDLHSCRHTFCYMAGMIGIPLAVVQSIVGHLSPEMTAHYTAHATREDKIRGIDAMPKFIAEAAGSLPATSATEEDAERAELLREIEALPTEELKKILDQIKSR